MVETPPKNEDTDIPGIIISYSFPQALCAKEKNQIPIPIPQKRLPMPMTRPGHRYPSNSTVDNSISSAEGPPTNKTAICRSGRIRKIPAEFSVYTEERENGRWPGRPPLVDPGPIGTKVGPHTHEDAIRQEAVWEQAYSGRERLLYKMGEQTLTALGSQLRANQWCLCSSIPADEVNQSYIGPSPLTPACDHKLESYSAINKANRKDYNKIPYQQSGLTQKISITHLHIEYPRTSNFILYLLPFLPNPHHPYLHIINSFPR